MTSWSSCFSKWHHLNRKVTSGNHHFKSHESGRLLKQNINVSIIDLKRLFVGEICVFTLNTD